MHTRVPIVAVGCYRDVATSTESAFSGTPYRIAAVLDLYDSPKAFTYSAQNLGTVLHTLNPRPKVCDTGEELLYYDTSTKAPAL